MTHVLDKHVECAELSAAMQTLDAKRMELGLEPEAITVDTDKCEVKTLEEFLIHDISDETCPLCDETHDGVCSLDIMFHEMKLDEWVKQQSLRSMEGDNNDCD